MEMRGEDRAKEEEHTEPSEQMEMKGENMP